MALDPASAELARSDPHAAYDVEADFYLLTTCNYRCDYCFLAPDALAARLTVHASNAEWQRAFDAGGRRWLLHITGGEPFLYPRFTDLCARLSQRHLLSLNTNLSTTQVESFAEHVDPRRVHFINAALHPDQRATRDGQARFVARVQRLLAGGFAVMVSVVMTPALIERWPKVDGELRAAGIVPIPKTLRDLHQGRVYPAAYTARERALLLQYLARAERDAPPPRDILGERATVDARRDGRFLHGARHYQGKLCASGHRFVSIEPNGDALRCSSGERLGNLLRGDLRLRRGPQVCDTHYCPYFCEKYTRADQLGTLSITVTPPASSPRARS